MGTWFGILYQLKLSAYVPTILGIQAGTTFEV